MTFALSEPVIQGLQNLGTTISLELTKTLIAKSVKLTLHPDATIPPMPEIYATSADKVKQSEYALVTFLALANKHTYNNRMLQQTLKEYSVDAAVVEELSRSYEDNRKELILRQLQVGYSFPHVTDVEWRIVCDVKSSTSDCSSGEVGFQINFGKYHQGTGERETIAEFLCNTEELQLLINKFKEIERHSEKISTG